MVVGIVGVVGCGGGGGGAHVPGLGVLQPHQFCVWLLLLVLSVFLVVIVGGT